MSESIRIPQIDTESEQDRGLEFPLLPDEEGRVVNPELSTMLRRTAEARLSRTPGIPSWPRQPVRREENRSA